MESLVVEDVDEVRKLLERGGVVTIEKQVLFVKGYGVRRTMFVPKLACTKTDKTSK